MPIHIGCVARFLRLIRIIYQNQFQFLFDPVICNSKYTVTVDKMSGLASPLFA